MPNYKNQACPKSIAKESTLRAKKKGVFDAAEKIGKLEFLNDFGRAGGNVRKGLEQIAIVSNTIRVGDSTPDSEELLAEDGSALMDSMNLGAIVQDAVAQFDPGAVNGAVGASKAIVDKARQGNFRMEDVAISAGEFKNIAQISGKIFKPPIEGAPGQDYQKFKCRPSPYAVDLVHRAPKQNFQFIVEIVLNAAYKNQFNIQYNENTGFGERTTIDDGKTIVKKVEPSQQLSTQLAFLVKTSGKPAPTYEYEDLNYYNFRTKGIRKASFNPVTMTFIDDQLNTASKFYAFYTSAMSPIVNMGLTTGNATGDRQNYEQRGMGFNDITTKHEKTKGDPNTFPPYAASVGALRPSNLSSNGSNSTKRIIDRVSIYQLGNSANTLTAYNMFGVRVMSFAPSDLTMAESGDGQSIGMELDYDYFTIQSGLTIGEGDGYDITQEHLASMSGGAAGAQYYIKHFQNQATESKNERDKSVISRFGSYILDTAKEAVSSGTSDPSSVETTAVPVPPQAERIR